jgi:hypothetical protein
MKQVLIANEEQYERLNGYENNNNHLIFTKDRDNRWVVGVDNIDNPEFIDIMEDLKELVIGEYLEPLFEI